MGTCSRWLAALLVSSCASAPLATGDPAPPAAGDGRRATSRFLANLGRNTVSVFARDNLAPFAIGAAATGAGAFFDDDAQRYFESQRRARWLGESGAMLGRPFVVTPLALVLFGSGRIAHNQRYRDASYDFAQAFLVTAAYTTAIKYATQRERPDGSDKLSFPSGHTSNFFAWATVAGHHYGPKLGVPAFVVAGLVGIARMESDVHHLSDVLAGATLGYLVGRTVVRKDAETPRGGAPVQVLPGIASTGISFAVAVRLPRRLPWWGGPNGGTQAQR